MKKEYFFILSVILVGLAYAIDFISGKISLSVTGPYQFLDTSIITKFPLTAVGIFARSLGLFILVWVIFSLFKGFFFRKAIFLFIILGLGNLYSIQQLSTGMKLTTTQWNISIAYASSLLIIPLIISLFKGATSAVSDKISPPRTIRPDRIETERITEDEEE